MERLRAAAGRVEARVERRVDVLLLEGRIDEEGLDVIDEEDLGVEDVGAQGDRGELDRGVAEAVAKLVDAVGDGSVLVEEEPDADAARRRILDELRERRGARRSDVGVEEELGEIEGRARVSDGVRERAPQRVVDERLGEVPRKRLARVAPWHARIVRARRLGVSGRVAGQLAAGSSTGRIPYLSRTHAGGW